MTATLSRVVLDRTAQPQMIVHPDFDSQLSDPAFAPPNTTQVDVLRTDYVSATSRRDLLAILATYTQANHPVFSNILTARVAVFDAVDQARADVDAEQALEAQWPTPTGPQQTLINIAKVRAVNSAQAAQTAIQNLATLVAALP